MDIMKQYAKLQEVLYGQAAVVPEDLKRDREAMEVYEIKKDGMTRQERRAYQRMLAKKRKH